MVNHNPLFTVNAVSKDQTEKEKIKKYEQEMAMSNPLQPYKKYFGNLHNSINLSKN